MDANLAKINLNNPSRRDCLAIARAADAIRRQHQLEEAQDQDAQKRRCAFFDGLMSCFSSRRNRQSIRDEGEAEPTWRQIVDVGLDEPGTFQWEGARPRLHDKSIMVNVDTDIPNSSSIETSEPASGSYTNSHDNKINDLYVARCDFLPRYAEDLTLRKGDVMRIISKSGDWWTAQLISTQAEPKAVLLWTFLNKLKQYEPGLWTLIYNFVHQGDYDHKKHLKRFTGKVPGHFIRSVDGKRDLHVEWFFNCMTRSTAALIILKASVGTFLVRRSEESKLRLCVRNIRGVKHYRIEYTIDGDLYIQSMPRRFPTLRSLVAYYQEDDHGLCCKLVGPPNLKNFPNPNSDEYPEGQTHAVSLHKRLSTCFPVQRTRKGDVWAGHWRKRQQKAVFRLFQRESCKFNIDIVRLLKGVDHANLVKTIDVVPENRLIGIVMETMKTSVVETLQEASYKEQDLIQMAMQVSDGMAYLEEKFIDHGDLSGTNVFLSSDNKVKIAGFALRNLFPGIPIKVKWSAPEVIWESEFSSKADVWSFGVVVHELFTKGVPPYPDMTDEEVAEVIKGDYRLPRACPNHVYSLLQQCWDSNPQKRPYFSEITEKLREILDPKEKTEIVKTAKPVLYLETNLDEDEDESQRQSWV
eukprot:m.61586 g.61586  ORF g.61586 m.61586 type:complete len:637 (+) comp11426_c0_seq2:227-2137(+)